MKGVGLVIALLVLLSAEAALYFMSRNQLSAELRFFPLEHSQQGKDKMMLSIANKSQPVIFSSTCELSI